MRRSDLQPQNRPSTHGYGIAKRARRRPFIVKFRWNKTNIHVGCYATHSEAITARDAYLRDHRQ